MTRPTATTDADARDGEWRYSACIAGYHKSCPLDWVRQWDGGNSATCACDCHKRLPATGGPERGLGGEGD